MATPAAARTSLEIRRSFLCALQIHGIGRDGANNLLEEQDNGSPPIVRVGDAIRPAHPNRSMVFPASDATPHYFDPAGSGEWHPLEHNRHMPDDIWTEAISIWVDNHHYAASPGSAETKLKSLVQASRERGILIPATSYIVVENEAQWRMLRKKEGQKLEQIEALDFLETSAPSTLFIVVGFATWLVWRRRSIL